jgi:lipid II:glycine glycyltransferase (peptidoglycan interpeptide bridge formation enzyme)
VARTSIRKAIKENIRIRFSDDIKQFYEILTHNYYKRHATPPTHTLPELIYLKKQYPEQIVLLGSYLDDKMIGGSILFICNPRVVMTFYLVMVTEYQKYRPINLLLFELTKWAIQNKFKYIDLGTITIDMDLNEGLARFKENFAARGIFRNTLELDLQKAGTY